MTAVPDRVVVANVCPDCGGTGVVNVTPSTSWAVQVFHVVDDCTAQGTPAALEEIRRRVTVALFSDFLADPGAGTPGPSTTTNS